MCHLYPPRTYLPPLHPQLWSWAFSHGSLFLKKPLKQNQCRSNGLFSNTRLFFLLLLCSFIHSFIHLTDSKDPICAKQGD